MKREHDLVERRLSREDGSDSSKDSSLQSDTSVDSEDSFASVIYVPKPDVAPLIDVITAPPGYQLSTASAPPSPRVKYPPDLSGPRLKMISISPLLKQFPATSKSLPPPSPPGLSPKTLNSTSMKPFFNHKNENNHPTINFLDKQFDFTIRKDWNETTQNQINTQDSPKELEDDSVNQKSNTLNFSNTRIEDNNLESKNTNQLDDKNNEEKSRKDRLKQIKELLYQKPGFATRMKPSFPLVRRASSAVPGRLETATKILPRLLSLELFNPETDDLDSDSSGVSSPESAGSVISVISDKRYLAKKEKTENNNEGLKDASSTSNFDDIPKESESSRCSKLIEAAANVASFLEDVAGTVIQKEQKGFNKDDNKRGSINSLTSETKHLLAASPEEVTWNEECRQHLLDFTEKLSENLIHDIDQYCQKTKLEINGELDQFPKKTEVSNTLDYCSISNPLQRKTSQDSCKYDDYLEFDNKPDSLDEDELIGRSASEETMDFVMVSKNGEFINESEVERKTHDTKLKEKYLRFGNSVESSDIGDSIENTISESSQGSTRRLGTGSTASLGSSNLDFSRCISERRKFLSQNRSASEEIPSKFISGRNHFERSRMTTGASNGTLSGSSSQESLPSDQGGGAITYHQYYHVFREGELDQLINKYVENLHIISSYYDHASWCIVAEKVQVWTI